MKVIKFTNGATPARFWNIAETGDDEGTIELYGDVVSEQPRDWLTGEAIEGQYITPEGFAEALETIKDKARITVKINSVGGDVYTGIAIHNALKALSGTKTVIVDGIAASAASVIAMAGDTIKVFPGSLMMIHGVSGFMSDWFNLGDLKKVMKSFDAIERALAHIYNAKTGIDETTLRGMMERETWFAGSEAIEKGFADEMADEIDPLDMAYSAESRILMVNGVKHNMDGVKIPERFNIRALAATPAPADCIVNQPEDEKELKAMDIKELRAKYPELVAQIEAEAVAADRARIQEIEEIQDTIGDAEMIAAAKYTKPTNAAALALAAMKKQAALGASFLQARAEEGKEADKVQASAKAAEPENPAAIQAATKEQEAAAIADLAAQYKAAFNK